MRHARVLASLARRLVFTGLLVCAPGAWAASCTTVSAACTEWIAMEGDLGTLVYRTHALGTRNDAVRRAIVIVHGGSRDAQEQFRNMLGAAYLTGGLDDTVIVSPRFASNEQGVKSTGENAVAAARSTARDSLAPNELNWVSQFGGRHWNAGGVAINAKVTSYEVVDEILTRLARKNVFPNLATIVVAGHSSGGQFVGRYQMVNRVHEKLGVTVTYLVSNPGAYTYLDSQRPTPSAIPQTVSAVVPGYVDMSTAKAPPPFVTYADARHCTTYDTWPYGIQHRVAYASRTTDDEIRKQAVSRTTTFLLGELDILPLVNFDISCNAMSQGSSRLTRGLAYARYVRENFGAQHKVIVVDGCGHHTRCMLTSNQALPLLFPKSEDAR